MRRTLFGLVLTAMMSGPVAAQQDEIRGVISAQVEAFLANDFATAFSFASPSIKGLFGSPERFGQMVRQG